MELHSSTIAYSLNRRLDYLISLPLQYSSEEADWPLILFLHGAGERGDNLQLLRKHGIPRIVSEMADFPFITISPQCPENDWWLNKLQDLKFLLDTVIKQYRVDISKMYLTGLSMGGFGTWHMAVEYPDLFAAIAPVCGGGLGILGFPERVLEIKDLPIWAFHGGKDNIVSAEESRILIRTLKDAGGRPLLKIYPEAGHDSWTETYSDPELYEWFMSNQKLG
ncbi:MAG: prolyl oligopeptidase family serine peptidase [Mesotoga sp.]|jgi:predicted peptidase|uniref:carboxylesterase family protein n=1 Tax=unclassified Mesotoga TaxID=1184398 RepID=UPI000EF19ADA|nr:MULTISPECIES: prolyl oligopeptidase family serine peptidase [unclassified Mesotoga]MDI9368904.1 prolyl oligopeptidase family serine peptidase [Thermotogota bacterium]NLT44018.1 prolyl oligopeptidase family serine peptidase [Thermotogaceae bacterium]MDD2332787.1 prolyl oligopeptidase family serine peptidase [Mesotoga sp.]MDD3680611.1 prolyl oligopeptidase family serine peptidase [Mesotoga sp.]MDD4207310.1 prolyl oligopeptidase family serine peptidase [Mesotoga sp.]